MSIAERHSAKARGIGSLRTGVKPFSLIIPLCDCWGHLENSLSGEVMVITSIRPVSCQQSSIPETIEARAGFSTKGVHWLTILPKNTPSYNKWTPNDFKVPLEIKHNYQPEHINQTQEHHQNTAILLRYHSTSHYKTVTFVYFYCQCLA